MVETRVTDRWSEAVAVAQRAADNEPRRSVNAPSTEATRAALRNLEAVIAETEPLDVAQHAVTAWLITRKPIAECIEMAREHRQNTDQPPQT